MTKEFIMKLAKKRAEEIFTKEYYQSVTDSWYLDELFRFEGMRIGLELRTPNEKEKDIYMAELSKLFDLYKEKFYSDELAQDTYGQVIDHFNMIFKIIQFGNEHYSKFNIDKKTIKKLKKLANIFVYKHNEFCTENDTTTI